MQFFKMHNQGNDYIFLFEKPSRSQIVRLCDRNFGIGGDGVVYIYNKDGIYGYEIYNKDGSRASFCGSVTLALGLYIYKKENKKSFSILTDCGIKKISVEPSASANKVCVEMDKVIFPKEYNLFNRLITLTCLGEKIYVRATLVDVGNKHLVIRGLYNEQKRKKIIQALEKHPAFFGGINVEFVERKSSRRARVIVYERGSGKTLCCSSGGVAVFAVLNALGHADKEMDLCFDGGSLNLKKQGKKILLSSYPKFLYFGNWCNL